MIEIDRNDVMSQTIERMPGIGGVSVDMLLFRMLPGAQPRNTRNSVHSHAYIFLLWF